MNSVQKKLSTILLAFAGFSGILYAQKYQRSFYGEESFRNPIQIPVEVSEKLKRDWQGRGCSDSNEQFSTSWFEATRINLNDDKFPDLLIKAKDPNHSFNGNAISFWVFANRGGKFNQVFYAYTFIRYRLKLQISDPRTILTFGRVVVLQVSVSIVRLRSTGKNMLKRVSGNNR